MFRFVVTFKDGTKEIIADRFELKEEDGYLHFLKNDKTEALVAPGWLWVVKHDLRSGDKK